MTGLRTTGAAPSISQRCRPSSATLLAFFWTTDSGAPSTGMHRITGGGPGQCRMAMLPKVRGDSEGVGRLKPQSRRSRLSRVGGSHNGKARRVVLVPEKVLVVLAGGHKYALRGTPTPPTVYVTFAFHSLLLPDSLDPLLLHASPASTLVLRVAHQGR